MPIRRVFLDWIRPALPAAAEWLRERRAANGLWDLSGVIVAVPGGQAGRRLLEVLVEMAEEHELAFVPPRILTPFALPEELYVPQLPFADDFTQELAWVRALRETDAERRRRLARALPEPDDLFGWLALAKLVGQLHRDLAADDLDFPQVIAQAEHLPAFDEAERWKILADVQWRYLRILDDLHVWDRQTARLVAIRRRECRAERDIVLVGTVDMNRAQRQMLDQVADRVTALVFAPAELEDRFDEHGCVVPEAWREPPRAVPEEIVEIVDGPAEQADAALRAIAALGGQYAADEITVGVPDTRLVPWLAQRFEESELPHRYGVGRTVEQTGPFRLLDAVARYLEERDAGSMAALLRHPALEAWLRRSHVGQAFQPALEPPNEMKSADASHQADMDVCPTGWVGDSLIDELDDYRATRLPTRLDARRIAAAGGRFRNLHKAVKAVDKLLAPLAKKKRLPGEWGDPIREILVACHGAEALDRDDPRDRETLRACDAIVDAAQQLARAHRNLAPAIRGVEALRLVLSTAAAAVVPPPMDGAAIELLGWLELPLDDAPALVLTGFNEGIVPGSRNADLFLPNELRRHLQLEDNDRRFARDAYALCLLSASRKELRIIAGRRSSDGDPLVPSRLLFAGAEERAAERTLKWFAAPPARRRILLPGSLLAARSGRTFPIPPLPPLEEPVTSMRVTEFRDYLACPYRYYLRHRLGLVGCDDAAEELDAGAFGTLLHDALFRFGSDAALRELIDPADVFAALDEILNRRIDADFGNDPLPAVRVQAEQIRQRLRAFARWQAEWAARGWRIRYVEESFRDEREAPFDVDGAPMRLRGKIDRIDQNDDSGEWIVFDYKTGESAASPEKTHRRKREWIDLQLPLYRHLTRLLDGIGEELKLGYIAIPKGSAGTKHHLADWTRDDLDSADETARTVIRGIRANHWSDLRPIDPPPMFFDEFASICQDGRFG
ncbi:MAG: PD-(D/E)XK nuclease family protein, partial [Planctomycetales bacterium]